MDESTPLSECPECGSPLEASGLCARCLMAGAAVPTEPASNAEGPDLEQVAAAFPQFEVLKLVGRGGMGSVFKVRQPKLNRLAALKLLPHSLAADPAFAGRFEREAQVLARLSHPNIVAVYDFGHSDGFFYLLMEFVDGVNLRQAMQAARFTPEQALSIVPKICEALQFAHDEGVLHRDIKPENLLLDPRGRVKLADFGIAKLAAAAEIPDGAEGDGHPLLTQAGASLGTPSYMAPEQRESPSEVDHRADIYSLGVVFYELLTGELPQQAFTAPSGKSTADPGVDAIVRQALEADRNFRQKSAGEVKTQVEALGAFSPEQKGGLKVADSFSAFAAIALSFAGTWETGRIDPPKSSSGVPVTVTSIGIGEPWLIEQRWMSAEVPGGPNRQVGGVHAVPSPWLFSEVAMILAGLCWTIWFLVKRRCGERLDSKLDESGGKPSFVSVANLWIGALGFSQWVSFSVLGLMMFFRLEWDLPLTLQFIFKINFLVAALWVFQGFARRWWGAGEMPAPGPWPARLVGAFSLIALAGFCYASARSAWRTRADSPAAATKPVVLVVPREANLRSAKAEPMTRSFHTTRWTLVRNSNGDSEEARKALGELCELYYEPVISFLQRDGRDRDAARELTHGFFSKVLAGDFLGEANEGRGRFRSYLLGALKHFIANQVRDENREKRGGGVERVELEEGHLESWPDADFDREWARSIIERALALLQWEEERRTEQFEILKPWLASGDIEESQEASAARLGMSTGALKVAIHRLRRRFRELVRTEVASTLHDPAEIDDEMRHLVEALSSRR